MRKSFVIAGAMMLAAASLATMVQAQDGAKADAKKTTSATYVMTGLHCRPCTQVVEKSLSAAPGVKSVKVDWETKNAKVEFDELKLPAQRVSQLIAATPHMMGASMHYGSWLALKVPELKDDAAAKKAKEVLSKVAGIKTVEAFPAQHIVEVQFAPEGKTTTIDLIDALSGAGIKAETF
jgi:copper chaperone CopZ